MHASVNCQHGTVTNFRTVVTLTNEYVDYQRLSVYPRGVVYKDEQDLEIAEHFMRSLSVALADKGMSRKDAETKAGLSHGTLTHWISGKRVPSALRLAQVCVKLGIDAGALVNDGYQRARAAGLLDDVEVSPVGEQSQEDV